MAKSHKDKAAKQAQKTKDREAQRAAAQAQNRAKSIKKTFIISVIVIIVLAIIWQLLSNVSVSTEGLDELSLRSVSPIDNVKGVESSTVTIIEYSDFQCPACAAYQPVVAELLDKYGDKITFVYRHFPLKQIHPFATIAAQAAEAAGNQGKFFEMHDLLFINQNDWTNGNQNEKFKAYAQQLELDIAQFEADLESDAVKAKVQHMYNHGIESNVRSTPTFYLNGIKLSVTPDVADFERRIEPYLP